MMTTKECVKKIKEILYIEVKNYNDRDETKKDLIGKQKVLEEIIDLIYIKI